VVEMQMKNIKAKKMLFSFKPFLAREVFMALGFNGQLTVFHITNVNGQVHGMKYKNQNLSDR
jgi:hypothetical protein